MVIKLSDIEITINSMDSHYDANFGTWIRNEKNAAIIGHHLSKYIDDYASCDFIVVVKWIVRSWTLRNILILSKHMLYDIKLLNNSYKKDGRLLRNRVCIITGLIYTWNSVFISEYLLGFMRKFELKQKYKVFSMVFMYLSKDRVDRLRESLYERVDLVVKIMLDRKKFLLRRSVRKEMKCGLKDAFLIN